MYPLGRLVSGKRGILSKYSLHASKCQKKSFTSEKVTSEEYKTVRDVRIELMKQLKADFWFTPNPEPRDHLLKYLAKSQDELPVRKMKDSFDTAIIPLATDLHLREKYTTILGHLRVGRLMEDIDIFAVWCCIKHLTHPRTPEGSPPPYTVVTIRVDHIEVLKGLRQPTSDVRLTGHISWVGTSSLEVIVWLDQETDGKWERITRALLLMAARDCMNTGPALVNRIEAETPEEKELLEGGEKRKLVRTKIMEKSLLKQVPSEKELHIVHDLFKNTIDSTDMLMDKRVLPPKGKWMEDAMLTSQVFCHPEHRNLNNKIFGGFLIRKAMELSWSIAYLYALRVPKLIHISDIVFFSPVELGSLVKLTSGVTYSEDSFIHVFCSAEAILTTTGTGAAKSTTSFNFTYDLGTECDSLYPLTYLEAMKYIDGRRHLYNVMKFYEKNLI